MIKILFVCHGNICRSPIAEFLMKDMVRTFGRSADFMIASAATTSDEIWNGRGNPIYPEALRELTKHGIGTADNPLGVEKKTARLLKRSDYEKFDYLIGMDEENLRDITGICGGDPENKISMLLDYTGQRRAVADPWYTRNFGVAWDDIEMGCRALLKKLKQKPQN